MRAFAELYQALDQTTASQQKLAALVCYLKSADPADAAWAVYFLSGAKIRRLLPTRELRTYALMRTGLPAWLFEEGYQAVGDLAETIALLLPDDPTPRADSLAHWVRNALLPLQTLTGPARLDHLTQALAGWDRTTRFVGLKLLTSGLRVGVSRLTVVRALAVVSGLPSATIAQRMVGYLGREVSPDAQRYQQLISRAQDGLRWLEPGQPYPFFLANSVAVSPSEFDATLGEPERWQIEWKWDGIRAQWVWRQGQVWLWSRSEELITAQFPELQAISCPASTLVLDGELLVWPATEPWPAPFAALQKRLGRKQVGMSLRQQLPVVFLAYDVLELDGQDLREQPLFQRRATLNQVVQNIGDARMQVSPTLSVPSWQVAQACWRQARSRRAEGLVLKATDSTYGVGRTRQAGLWLKWKLDPMSVDVVLVYAQRGHGRRASLYTDYTFAVWNKPAGEANRELVPVAKAYSGLSDSEIRQVDQILRRSTLESFGPVRRVTPTLVFELGFEGIAPSARHKSGVALRFPRMLRWRMDKTIEQADSLDTLRALL